MTAEEMLAVFEDHRLNCWYNRVASEPRWEVWRAQERPALHENLLMAVEDWVKKYATVCQVCGK